MNISGVVVHAHPKDCDAVEKRLSALSGVEIHAISPQGKMVVTVEDDDHKMIADTLLNMQNIRGVLSAVMIYNHFEEESELNV